MLKKLNKFLYLVAFSIYFINPLLAAAAKKPTFKTEEEEENLRLVQQYEAKFQAQQQAQQKSAAAASSASAACAPAPKAQKHDSLSGALLLKLDEGDSHRLHEIATEWHTLRSGEDERGKFKTKSTLYPQDKYHITLFSFRVPTAGIPEAEQAKLKEKIKAVLEELKQTLIPLANSVNGFFHWLETLKLTSSMRALKKTNEVYFEPIRFEFQKKYDVLEGEKRTADNPPHYFVALFELDGDAKAKEIFTTLRENIKLSIKKAFPTAVFPVYGFTPHVSLVKMSPAITIKEQFKNFISKKMNERMGIFATLRLKDIEVSVP